MARTKQNQRKTAKRALGGMQREATESENEENEEEKKRRVEIAMMEIAMMEARYARQEVYRARTEKEEARKKVLIAEKYLTRVSDDLRAVMVHATKVRAKARQAIKDAGLSCAGLSCAVAEESEKLAELYSESDTESDA